MGKCKLENYFGWPPDIRKQKLYRYAKQGRPGVKTEYNENYRDWKNSHSKWDYLAVSVYSQEELRKRAKADRTPPTGWPCRQFNVTIGEDDNTILEPMDPYSDEWFDNYDLASALKVKAAKIQQRPGAKTSKTSVTSQKSETHISRGSNLTNFRHKMIKFDSHVKSAANTGCDCKKVCKPCVKRKQAWVSCEKDDCPKYPYRKNTTKQSEKVQGSNGISRQASKISNKDPIPRQASKVTSEMPVSRQASRMYYNEVSPQPNRVQRDVPRQKSCTNITNAKNTLNVVELSDALEDLKTNITQHKALDVTQAVDTSQKGIPTVRSADSVLSFSSSDTPRPASAHSTVYKQIPASGDVKSGLKKATFGQPQEIDRAVCKNLLENDREMMRNMYNKVVEPQHKKYISKAYSQEEYQRLYDETKRTTQNPYARDTTQDWKTNQVEDYAYYDSYFDEVEKKRNPHYLMDNDIFNMRARAKQKKAQTLYHDQYEDKTEHPMMFANDNKFAKGDKKDKEEKIYSGRSYTADERAKIIADGNKLLERQSKDQSTVDSRWKSYNAYQNWNPAEREIPVWAEKTFKSLGSGFWNLPFNKDNDWKKREQIADIERNRLRIEAKKCMKEKTPEEVDPFLANYYPDIRTNPIFMSQYLRDYYRRPLPGDDVDD